ncbi:hypothetical protein B0T16DRAFT_456149 [Cercophora newfieldiana]|uniref:Uncharacterized protein n=1 Tax=Cercophora newfieldiana TaxID=92897 RepID=A0AA39Y9T1_9PEZI|nr:hypothetical protein B0T16DRAFT_456149 [Cercophora newfieldiana]
METPNGAGPNRVDPRYSDGGFFLFGDNSTYAGNFGPSAYDDDSSSQESGQISHKKRRLDVSKAAHMQEPTEEQKKFNAASDYVGEFLATEEAVDSFKRTIQRLCAQNNKPHVQFVVQCLDRPDPELLEALGIRPVSVSTNADQQTDAQTDEAASVARTTRGPTSYGGGRNSHPRSKAVAPAAFRIMQFHNVLSQAKILVTCLAALLATQKRTAHERATTATTSTTALGSSLGQTIENHILWLLDLFFHSRKNRPQIRCTKLSFADLLFEYPELAMTYFDGHWPWTDKFAIEIAQRPASDFVPPLVAPEAFNIWRGHRSVAVLPKDPFFDAFESMEAFGSAYIAGEFDTQRFCPGKQTALVRQLGAIATVEGFIAHHLPVFLATIGATVDGGLLRPPQANFTDRMDFNLDDVLGPYHITIINRGLRTQIWELPDNEEVQVMRPRDPTKQFEARCPSLLTHLKFVVCQYLKGNKTPGELSHTDPAELALRKMVWKVVPAEPVQRHWSDRAPRPQNATGLQQSAHNPATTQGRRLEKWDKMRASQIRIEKMRGKRDAESAGQL